FVGIKKWIARAMQAPTGTASNVCGRVLTTAGVANAVSAAGRWGPETIAVCGWSSSTEVFIFRRLSYSSRDTEHWGRPDSALPGPADRTFSWRSRHPFHLVESIRRRAVYSGSGRSDRRELFLL